MFIRLGIQVNNFYGLPKQLVLKCAFMGVLKTRSHYKCVSCIYAELCISEWYKTALVHRLCPWTSVLFVLKCSSLSFTLTLRSCDSTSTDIRLWLTVEVEMALAGLCAIMLFILQYSALASYICVFLSVRSFHWPA